MKAHFMKGNTPLQSLEDYPLSCDQEKRLKVVGFHTCKSTLLTEVLNWHMGQSELALRKKLESEFDEFEELILKCSHYTILEALSLSAVMTGRKLTLDHIPRPEGRKQAASARGFSQPAWPSLQRFGHNCVSLKNRVLVAGGCTANGLKDQFLAVFDDLYSQPLWTGQLAIKGMFSALGEWSECVAFIHGGRGSPSEACNALIKMELREDDSVIQTSIDSVGPRPRWRHTMSRVNSVLVIVGGMAEQPLSDIWTFNPDSGQWEEAKCSLPHALHSHSAVSFQDKLFVTGGLDQNGHVIREVLIVANDTVRVVDLPGLLPRFSHCSIVREGEIYLIGGVSDAEEEPGVAVVDARELQRPVRELKLAVPKGAAAYCGSIVAVGDSITLVGGGGNCFSFGSHLASKCLRIDTKFTL